VLEGFLRAIHEQPTELMHWLVLADWLDDQGQTDRAELLRLRQRLIAPIDAVERRPLEKRLQELILAGTEPVVARWIIELPSSVELELSLIPPGVFLMGSYDNERDRYDNEGPVHSVTITQPFYLGVVPVTQRQWSAVMGNNPSSFVDENRPVEGVNWQEAQEFCAEVSRRLGRRCRLPYEAEWEYACRAGTTTAFYTGDNAAAMKKAGWCSHRGEIGNARKTKPVAQYLPNAFGLYDMHGNVREWCQDDLRKYTSRARVDPRGKLKGNNRVVRGGSWYYSTEDSRSASRYSRPIHYHLDYYGFRIVVECAPSRC
jgi:uncharacterized protein (TIGR02996 family)